MAYDPERLMVVGQGANVRLGVYTTADLVADDPAYFNHPTAARLLQPGDLLVVKRPNSSTLLLVQEASTVNGQGAVSFREAGSGGGGSSFETVSRAIGSFESENGAVIANFATLDLTLGLRRFASGIDASSYWVGTHAAFDGSAAGDILRASGSGKFSARSMSSEVEMIVSAYRGNMETVTGAIGQDSIILPADGSPQDIRFSFDRYWVTDLPGGADRFSFNIAVFGGDVSIDIFKEDVNVVLSTTRFAGG